MPRAVLLALAVCLTASACAQEGQTVAQSPPPATATAPASTPATAPAPPSEDTTSAPGSEVAAAVPEGLQFTADLVGGGQLRGGELAGRDVVLWFWAPW